MCAGSVHYVGVGRESHNDTRRDSGHADRRVSLLVRAGVEEDANFLFEQGLSRVTKDRYRGVWDR